MREKSESSKSNGRRIPWLSSQYSRHPRDVETVCPKRHVVPRDILSPVFLSANRCKMPRCRFMLSLSLIFLHFTTRHNTSPKIVFRKFQSIIFWHRLFHLNRQAQGKHQTPRGQLQSISRRSSQCVSNSNTTVDRCQSRHLSTYSCRNRLSDSWLHIAFHIGVSWMMTPARQQAILISRSSYSSFLFQKAGEDDSAMYSSSQRSTLTVFYNIILQRHRVPLHSDKLLFRIARFKRTTITNDFNTGIFSIWKHLVCSPLGTTDAI